MTAPKSTHVAWNFVQKDGYNLSCQLCGHNFNGDLTRAVEHLLGISNGSGSGVEACTKITDEQKATVCKDRFNSQMQKQKRVNKRQQIEREIVMSSSNTINSVSNIGGSSCTRAKTGGTKTSNQFWKPVEKQEVDDAVAEFFYACAIPFNVARSPYFKNVIKKAIDFGKGYVPPGSKALGTTLLKRTKDRVPGKFADIKESWKVTGCTILSDGWSDLCHRSLINVFVYCPRGVFLLKTIDATDQVKTSKFIFEILNKAIVEVGVGNVVHVVTDTASNCVDAGDLIMKKYNQIYWTPCASHYLYLMLQDLAKFYWVDETIKGAKTISNFIINHSLTLSIYMKNASKELLRPCDTKITTFYATLKTIVEEKASVSAVFCNNEWKRSTLSKEIEGKNVEQIVLNHGFWENANKVLKICGPIIDVIRMVDGDKPCMGFVYEKINCCKKTIATAFNNVEADYKEIWDLIDHRWKKMYSPLYAAACYLNPRLFELRRHRDQEDKEIMNELFQCIEKLNPNRVAANVIKSQLWQYCLENGLFGDKSAKDDRTRSDPALWWESYGSGVPELQNFAIRILSQGTSTLACERKWSSFDHIHSKKKNRLLFGRSKDLVYVRNNLQLAVKGNKSKYDDEQEDNSDDAYGLETSSDLSQAFSDSVCSSSDISRELLRLATASSSPVYSPNNFRNNNNDLLKEPVSQAQCMSKLAKSRQFEEERIRSEEERVQSNPHTSSSTTKATSESKNELLEPEKLEFFVKGLVDDLGPGNSKSVQRKAAADLRRLAKDKMENRTMIAKAGAVMPLICLLHSTDPQTQEAAVTALLNLSLCDDNIIKISQAGAIKPLIDVLKAGTSVAKQNAAFALSRLSRKDDNKVTIGAEGAIPHLVALLISGSSRGKKDAATTLYTLSSRTLNKDRAIRAGAIKPLVELMEDPYSGMADKAVVVLRNLASVPDGNTAIVEHGGIPVLVKMIEFGSQKGREFATETLLHLCEHSYLYRNLVLKEGVIPPLMVLSQSGTARAKAKAATLLWYLRECQESL